MLAILYGGLVQTIAGILAWRDGNTLAMAAFLTYGVFNIWFGLFELFSANGIITPSASLTAFGVTILGFGIITACDSLARSKTAWRSPPCSPRWR